MECSFLSIARQTGPSQPSGTRGPVAMRVVGSESGCAQGLMQCGGRGVESSPIGRCREAQGQASLG